MGLDCPGVRKIIYWGPPPDLESYIQETGRGGRDGKTAYASLLYSKRDIAQYYVEDTMKHYCENSTLCRRSLLFCNFGMCDTVTSIVVGCMCCDVCAKLCNCPNCT